MMPDITITIPAAGASRIQAAVERFMPALPGETLVEQGHRWIRQQIIGMVRAYEAEIAASAVAEDESLVKP